MIGRHVKSGWYGLDDGEIVRWEPLGSAMTDVLVKDVATGRLCWYASHSLTPIDGLGPLPSREAAREVNREQMLRSLEEIREQHVEDWHRPWPGMEFCKALFGKAVDGAIADLRKR